MIQPIVVRPHGHGYQIVAGERRWRAAQRAQLHEVPVVVRDFDDAETLRSRWSRISSAQDLNAIEEAQAYQRLMRANSAIPRRRWPRSSTSRAATSPTC